MGTVVMILSILLLVLSAVLVIAVIFQSGKQAGLPGSVSGAADTFFSKNSAKSIDAILAKATTIVAILFLVVVIALNFAVNKKDAPVDEGTPTELTDMDYDIPSGQDIEGQSIEGNGEGTENPENIEGQENTENPENNENPDGQPTE